MWKFKKYEGFYFQGGRTLDHPLKGAIVFTYGKTWLEIEVRKFKPPTIGYPGAYTSVFYCLVNEKKNKEAVATKEQEEYAKAFEEFTKR